LSPRDAGEGLFFFPHSFCVYDLFAFCLFTGEFPRFGSSSPVPPFPPCNLFFSLAHFHITYRQLSPPSFFPVIGLEDHPVHVKSVVSSFPKLSPFPTFFFLLFFDPLSPSSSPVVQKGLSCLPRFRHFCGSLVQLTPLFFFFQGPP